MSLFDLSGRTAVVVGGTSGIGRVLALGLADAGADVVVTGRRADRVEAVAAEVKQRGRRTLAMAADAADAGSLERLLDACQKELGGVHIMIYAAGVTRRIATLEMDAAEWNRIINIGSLTSFVGMFEVAAYTASKAGVAGLTRALAVEWASANVTVNAIAPGVFRTDLNSALLDSPRGQELLTRTPMHRFGKLEDLAGAAVYLASDAASFVTGHVLAVDGGFLASGVNQ